MTENEIKEAIEELKSCIKKYGDIPTLKTLKPLLTLAEEYLKIEGWPEKRTLEYVNMERVDNPSYISGEEWNEALHLCKLAAMKEHTGMKESSKEA